MTALALGYIYTTALIGLVATPFAVGKKTKLTAEGSAINLVMNVIESILILSLWSNSDFAYRTPVVALLLIANLCFMVQSIVRIGKEGYYSTNRAVFDLMTILITVVIASLLAFG